MHVPAKHPTLLPAERSLNVARRRKFGRQRPGSVGCSTSIRPADRLRPSMAGSRFGSSRGRRVRPQVPSLGRAREGYVYSVSEVEELRRQRRSTTPTWQPLPATLGQLPESSSSRGEREAAASLEPHQHSPERPRRRRPSPLVTLAPFKGARAQAAPSFVRHDLKHGRRRPVDDRPAGQWSSPAGVHL